MLAIYTALRPRRSSAEELESWAHRLDELGAELTAAFVRDAAVSTHSEACLHPDERSARFVAREERELRREVLIEPLAELGLVAMDGPNDPEPSLVIVDGEIVELDGRPRDDWDALDHFVAGCGLDLEVAAGDGARRSRAGTAARRCRRAPRGTGP